MSMPQSCPTTPPSIVINRHTGEVTYRPISEEERTFLWAQVLCAQMDLEEKRT